jgi:hypothetical protein
MSYLTGLSRRRLLATVGAAAAGAAVGIAGSSALAQAAPTAGIWSKRNSQNGWPVVDAGKVRGFTVEGSNAAVSLLPGDVAIVLLHVARRFHYEIGTLHSGDVHGHSTARTIGAPLESNYLSGTAVGIRPNLYTAGSAGNLFARELVIIRDILAECEGVVRWGGDDKDRPNEGHFQIDVAPGHRRLTQIAERIRSWQEKPGQGAGSAVEPLASTRRSAAKALERTQKRG